MSAEGLSDEICRRIAATDFADLPEATRTAARHVLLDTVGVVLAASGLAPEARPFIELAASGGTGPASILGTGMNAAPVAAAFANGAMVHALDFEDAFDPAPGHPNASLVPALLALSQAGSAIGGREFLTALAVGGDLSCRLGLALDRPMEDFGWYPPPMVAAYGAAVGAGKLLGLDAPGLRDCLSLTLCQATMPGEIKHSRGTVIRAVREAFPAQAAVQSALLAQMGVTGFEQPVEGRAGFYALYAGGEFSPSRLLDGLGERFWIEQLTFKPWPSCRGTHPFIEAALQLRGRIDDLASIERLEFSIDPVQQMLVEPAERKARPDVVIDAKFSIPFCTALALVRGEIGLSDFDAAALADETVTGLAGRSSCVVAPVAGGRRGSSGSLDVHLADGTVMTATVADALGAPSRPLGEQALRAKFLDCAARAERPPADPAGLADAILSLESCRDVGRLFDAG